MPSTPRPAFRPLPWRGVDGRESYCNSPAHQMLQAGGRRLTNRIRSWPSAISQALCWLVSGFGGRGKKLEKAPQILGFHRTGIFARGRNTYIHTSEVRKPITPLPTYHHHPPIPRPRPAGVMSEDGPPVPETRVLAVASHVVSGYVGNKIAVFSMQSLGCDVAALNTVQFSNHTGYRQWTGTRVSAQEITDLYRGLKQSYLDDFDMMLSGYVPGAAALEAVGEIASELKTRAKAIGKPGSFFWVLDPVMGDNGTLYVAQDVVPVYRSLVPHADLILPNQFEAELLSDVKITDMASLGRAIQVMHERYRVPHIVITSVSLSHPDHPVSSLSVVGSTMTSDHKSRAFKIVFPAIDCYFSGTGDMFAALMVVRMREAVCQEGSSLMETESWRSEDSVDALDLPLAKAAERVLASMHEVLTKTAESMEQRMEKVRAEVLSQVDGEGADNEEATKTKLRLLKSKAAELKLVRHVDSLRFPKVEFRAKRM